MPIENEEAIKHLETLIATYSLDAHNARIDALSWLINDRVRWATECERWKALATTLEGQVAELGVLRLEVETLRGRLAGPRCECCSSLCIDLAKDERGFCPSCSTIPEVP